MTSKEKKCLEGYIDSYYSSYFQMDGIYNQWASANKILDTTLFVLNEISKEEYCTQLSLKEQLGYSKQTISAALKRLEEGGIITRQRALRDQRNNVIRLTPEGKCYADKLLGRLRAAELRAFESLTEEERVWVTDAFCKLTTALEQSLREDIERK